MEGLDTKLLHIAVVGRYASMWTFFIVISYILALADIASEKSLLLQALTVAIFLSGVYMLYEEIGSKNKKAKRKPR